MGKYDCEGCKHRTNHTDEGFKFCSGCDRAYCGADSGYHADRYEKEEAEKSMTVEEAVKNVTAYVYMEAENIPTMVAKALDVLKDKARVAEQFEEIGTISEFRELKEKANDACKWEDESRHVVCGHGQVEYRYKVRDWSFCPYCGKKAMVNDWSEGKEL